MFGKKKYSNLTLMDVFSDEILQYTLESLSWEKIEIQNRPVEHIRFSAIPNSKITSMLLNTLFEEKIKIGDYIYHKAGNRLQRENPRLREKIPEKKEFRISEPFKTIVDLTPRRVVKVE